MVQAMSGMPPMGLMFLPGIPLEPPRAVMRPTIRVMMEQSQPTREQITRSSENRVRSIRNRPG